jgi:hypothetical protein
MLRIVQPTTTARSGRVSRRELLAIGAGGLGVMTLPALLRAETAAGNARSSKSIIFVHLDGGPPQMDTIDPKPLAPSEIRGEFAPIESSVPGIRLSEWLPKMAADAERFAFIRSLVGSDGRHHAFQCQSGFLEKDLQSMGGRPALGCVVSKLSGRPDDPAPAFVDVMQGRPLVRNSARPGFLGPAYGPFRPDISHLFQRELEPGMQGELARLGANHKLSLTLNTDLTVDRLDDRRSLLAGLDRVRRDVDASGMMDAMDRFHQQATGILTSGRLAEALDLGQEDPEVTRRYLDSGIPEAEREHYTADGPRATLKFLMARRLIEAGARVVSLTVSDFDTHSNNFGRMRQALPIVDHGLTTLLSDLDERGRLEDVMVVAWGEFGRTPTINKNSGRDHWPRVGPCLLAGGGLRTGQVIGATDRYAGEVRSRPVTYKDVFCTLYRHLGIDARQVTLADPQGRPQYVLDEGEPLAELI